MTPGQLKAWRSRHALTQQELAQALGLTANAVARWERGERTPPPYLYLALRELARDYAALA